MAGYFIYSLDWDKFQRFVNNPTDKQLLALTRWISEGQGGDDDEDSEAVRDWPTEPEELRGQAKERLSRNDWYGDLSDAGKQAWEIAVNYFCSAAANGVGFRADHDGVYWDLLELAWKHLNVTAQVSPEVALSAFGRRPYRYFPAANDSGSMDDDYDFDTWQPMHSMHTPDEVRRMLDEFQTIAPAIEASKNKQAIYDYDALIPVLEQLADEGRMLFIQVDT